MLLISETNRRAFSLEISYCRNTRLEVNPNLPFSEGRSWDKNDRPPALGVVACDGLLCTDGEQNVRARSFSESGLWVSYVDLEIACTCFAKRLFWCGER